MLDSLDTLIAFVLIMLVVSLLITIVVQMAAALFNLRGWNLLVGLKSTFTVIAPSLRDKEGALAGYLLKGGLLSDSFLPNSFLKKWNKGCFAWAASVLNRWRHSSAIRPGELFDAIHRIASGNEYKDPSNPTAEERGLVENAKQLLAALGIQVAGLPEALAATHVLGDTVKKALASITDLAVKDKAEKAFTTVTSKLQEFERNAVRAGVTAAGGIDEAYKKFHYWTCIAEERAQQWFTMHTRILTVIFAFIFAFALQLDTVEIFKLVSSNKTLRDKLVAQAGVAETQAANLLSDDNNMLQSALKAWSDKQTDSTLKDALAKIDIQPADTREMVQRRVGDVLKGKPQPVGSFEASVKDVVTKKLDKKAGAFQEVRADLDKTGFQLFSDSQNGRWGRGQGLCLGWWRGAKGHRWGILFSVGLLSLGAPFWYHALKDLVNLRSQVAQNISDAQAQKKPDLDKPPPTIKPPPPSDGGGTTEKKEQKAPEKPSDGDPSAASKQNQGDSGGQQSSGTVQA